MSQRTWSATDISATQLQKLPVDTIVVATDGSISAVEQARTALERAYPDTFAPQTGTEIEASNQPLVYYLVLAGGLIASLAMIGSTLSLLDRATGPDTARNE